jgi:hypothetical protein
MRNTALRDDDGRKEDAAGSITKQYATCLLLHALIMQTINKLRSACPIPRGVVKDWALPFLILTARIPAKKHRRSAVLRRARHVSTFSLPGSFLIVSVSISLMRSSVLHAHCPRIPARSCTPPCSCSMYLPPESRSRFVALVALSTPTKPDETVLRGPNPNSNSSGYLYP